jgi:hypothetical protein
MERDSMGRSRTLGVIALGRRLGGAQAPVFALLEAEDLQLFRADLLVNKAVCAMKAAKLVEPPNRRSLKVAMDTRD